MNKNLFTLLFHITLVALSWVNAQEDEVENEWEKYKRKFRKGSAEDVEITRKRMFAHTHARIREHNSRRGSRYQMEHNQFSDMSVHERKSYLGSDFNFAAYRNLPVVKDLMNEIEDRQLPLSLDYRNDTCLAPVKNQGNCGSCWAFTATASLEFSRCKRTGSRVVLSEQQLVDCDTGNGGCNGGWFTTAWSYLMAGSALSDSYAYTAVRGTCRFVTAMTAARTVSMGGIPPRNPSAMQRALVQHGPLATAMNVVSSFFSYRSGVYEDVTCTVTSGFVNHGVNVVGYGTLNGVDHWAVRNSWGPNWGSGGYFLIRRGVNMCNIEMYPAFVSAAD